jgi:hypothetical protein
MVDFVNVTGEKKILLQHAWCNLQIIGTFAPKVGCAARAYVQDSLPAQAPLRPSVCQRGGLNGILLVCPI